MTMNHSIPSTTSPRRSIRPAGGSGGFTLVELLVVIGIIVLLLGLLTAAVMRGVPLAQRSATQQWMGSISLAIQNYARDVGELPPEEGGDEIDRSNNLYQAIANPFRHEGKKFPAYISGGSGIAEKDDKVVFIDKWEGVIDYRVDPDPESDDLPEDYAEQNRVSINAAPFLLQSYGPDTIPGTSDDIIVTGN